MFSWTYTLLQNALGKVRNVVDIADRFAARLNNLGDSTQTVLVVHQKVFSSLLYEQVPSRSGGTSKHHPNGGAAGG